MSKPRLSLVRNTLDSLPWPPIGKPIVEYILAAPLFLETGHTIPAGTTVRLAQTRDFGWLVLPKGTKDTNGYEMHRHIYKF